MSDIVVNMRFMKIAIILFILLVSFEANSRNLQSIKYRLVTMLDKAEIDSPGFESGFRNMRR